MGNGARGRRGDPAEAAIGCGTLTARTGSNVAVEPLGDLTFTASTSNVNALEPGFRPPTFDTSPNLSPDRFRLVSDIDDAISGLDEHLRNRVELSLQWFFDALNNVGVDGFLSYWFALDALVMPKPSGVNTFEKRLGGIYGLNQSDVRRRFRLGRLKDVRDRIAHEALRPPIHFRVLDFLSALYWDALLDILQLGAPGAAGRVLDEQNIDAWFPVPPADTLSLKLHAPPETRDTVTP